VIPRPRVIVPAAALLALATACGHLPPCPAAGGPQWTQLESAHFRLRTDDDPDAGRAMLTDLEQLRAALLTVFGASPDVDIGRLSVVVVDRGWTDFAARQVDGYFTHILFQPLIVMSAASQAFQLGLIKHELVHYMSAKIIKKQPPWFSEGVATYYQTIEYDADTGHITVGRPTNELLRRALEVSASNIESMFAAKKIDPDDASRFYAAAWITVHYLMNHRAAALEGYERALRGGATPETAWTSAFGSQTRAQVASEIRQYVDGGRYELRIYALAPPRLAPPVEGRLPDADVHATRALLYLTGRGTRDVAPELSLAVDDPKAAAKREVEEALRAQADHVVAGALAHFAFKAPVDVVQARHATQADPKDWLAWMLLAEGLRSSGDEAGGDTAALRAINLASLDRSIELPAAIVERN
jgi:hypothetical protein